MASTPDEPQHLPDAADASERPVADTADGLMSDPPQDTNRDVPIAPGSGWQQNPPGEKPRPGSRLPWVLVAMLSVVCVGLVGVISNQRGELQNSRAAAQSAVPSGVSSTTADRTGVTSQPTAQATPDKGTRDLMDRLPRRQEGDPTAVGAVGADVVMVMWSDFRCPFCALWARNTYPALKPYIDAGSLRIEHRDKVQFGDQSRTAAIAARAGGEQDKYWEFFAALHDAAPTSGHPEITRDDLTSFAKAAGVPDLDQFVKDMDDKQLAAAVDSDTQEGASIGINSVPFFLINHTPISGAQPTESFITVLEDNGATK